MSLRPHAVSLSALVHDVVPIEGGYAVLTASAIEIVDPDLRPVETIAGAASQTDLRVLADGRFVAFSDVSKLRVARRGGALAEVPELERVHTVAATRDGFIAVAHGKVWLDRGGDGRWLEVPHAGTGSCAWGDRVAVTGPGGISVIDGDGNVTAIDVLGRGAAAAFGDLLAIPLGRGVRIYRGDGTELAHAFVAADAKLARLGDLVIASDDEGVSALSLDTPDESFATFDELRAAATRRGWFTRAELRGVLPDASPEDIAQHVDILAGQLNAAMIERAATPRWHVAIPSAQAPQVIGERVVVGSYAIGKAWIIDAAGAAIELALPGKLWEARGFDGGIALLVGEHADVLWWRPGADLARLGHDVAPRLLRDVPAGLAVLEANHVYLWRTDVQGPEYSPVATSIPLEVPIVAAGRVVRALAPKRFVVLAQTSERKIVALAPDAPWRAAIGRDDALAVVQRLVARDVEGELPPIPTEESDDARAKLALLPPMQTATLHARALFAPTTLDKHARDVAMWAREPFYAELGAALGLSGRTVAAAVRGRKYPLVPPREVAGYDYLGTFTTSGALVVADPAYVGSKRAPGAFSLAVRVKGLEGLWHVFVRNGDGAESDRTAELVAIHSDGFDTYATEVLGTIGVDSGCAGIYDKACPKRDRDMLVEEGVQGGLGALAWSGMGDGVYPVYAGKIRGIVVKLRIGFLDGTDIDRTFAVPRSGRVYSPKTRFALGETIEHPKFGSGTVTAVGDGGKIDVTFSDGQKRTLVHAKA
jgi:hypothetical protein